MLKRTRISRSLDVNRTGEALSRPGIDPRMNVMLGWVEKFVVDKDHGVFAAVRLQNEQLLTCRVGTFYGGPGFGFYAPLQVDDEVVVAVPAGDPDHGAVVIAKTWSASELQPPEANDHQADVILHVQKDTNVRILATGNGNVIVGSEDGKTLLGAETGTQPVHRKGDHSDMGTFVHTPASGPGVVPCVLAWTPPGGGPPVPITAGGADLTAQAKDGSDKVESS